MPPWTKREVLPDGNIRLHYGTPVPYDKQIANTVGTYAADLDAQMRRMIDRGTLKKADLYARFGLVESGIRSTQTPKKVKHRSGASYRQRQARHRRTRRNAGSPPKGASC